jgi:pimeloyl-ACP methyl ester carboxylesterase
VADFMTGNGHDMNHCADDLAELTQHLDLRDAVPVGHSAGGGEVARYIGRHGGERVAKVALISAVIPSVLQADANPVGTPQAGFVWQNGTLKSYDGFPHGMPTTHAERINPDLLAFIEA